MASLISPQLKDSLLSSIDDMHDTFGVDITVIRELANATITDDPNYNAFGDNDEPSITYSADSSVIKARVKYLDKPDSQQQLMLAGMGSGARRVTTDIKQNYGIVRIKVKKIYTDLVLNSSKVIINGESCQLLYNYFSQNMIDLNYSVFYLTREL
jgi:hypothetical protein